MLKQPDYRPLNGLIREQQQPRITDKSEYLLDLERRQAETQARTNAANRSADPAFDDSLLPELLRRMAT